MVEVNSQPRQKAIMKINIAWAIIGVPLKRALHRHLKIGHTPIEIPALKDYPLFQKEWSGQYLLQNTMRQSSCVPTKYDL